MSSRHHHANTTDTGSWTAATVTSVGICLLAAVVIMVLCLHRQRRSPVKNVLKTERTGTKQSCMSFTHNAVINKKMELAGSSMAGSPAKWPLTLLDEQERPAARALAMEHTNTSVLSSPYLRRVATSEASLHSLGDSTEMLTGASIAKSAKADTESMSSNPLYMTHKDTPDSPYDHPVRVRLASNLDGSVSSSRTSMPPWEARSSWSFENVTANFDEKRFFAACDINSQSEWKKDMNTEQKLPEVQLDQKKSRLRHLSNKLSRFGMQPSLSPLVSRRKSLSAMATPMTLVGEDLSHRCLGKQLVDDFEITPLAAHRFKTSSVGELRKGEHLLVHAIASSPAVVDSGSLFQSRHRQTGRDVLQSWPRQPFSKADFTDNSSSLSLVQLSSDPTSADGAGSANDSPFTDIPDNLCYGEDSDRATCDSPPDPIPVLGRDSTVSEICQHHRSNTSHTMVSQSFSVSGVADRYKAAKRERYTTGVREDMTTTDWQDRLTEAQVTALTTEIGGLENENARCIGKFSGKAAQSARSNGQATSNRSTGDGEDYTDMATADWRSSTATGMPHSHSWHAVPSGSASRSGVDERATTATANPILRIIADRHGPAEMPPTTTSRRASPARLTGPKEMDAEYEEVTFLHSGGSTGSLYTAYIDMPRAPTNGSYGEDRLSIGTTTSRTSVGRSEKPTLPSIPSGTNVSWLEEPLPRNLSNATIAGPYTDVQILPPGASVHNEHHLSPPPSETTKNFQVSVEGEYSLYMPWEGSRHQASHIDTTAEDVYDTYAVGTSASVITQVDGTDWLDLPRLTAAGRMDVIAALDEDRPPHTYRELYRDRTHTEGSAETMNKEYAHAYCLGNR